MYAVILGTLDLTTGGYGVTSFDASVPGRIRLNIDVDADDTKTAVDLVRGIRTQLNQATRAAQPASGIDWVTLAVQASANSETVEFPVRRGRVNAPIAPIGFEEGWVPRVFVELETLPYALGEAIEYGPFAVTGADPTFHLDGIPGDMPALAEIRFEDQSDGVVVNRIRMAARSMLAMDEGDFDPVLAVGGGEEDDDTFAGSYQSHAAITAWQAIGAMSSAASIATSGLFDIWARIKDATESLETPTNLQATETDAISVVQAISNSAGFSGTDRISLNWNKPTTAGNLLILVVAWRSSDTVSVPAGWTLAVEESNSIANVRIYYKANAASESGSVVVTWSDDAGYAFAAIREYRGIATSSPLDATSADTDSGTIGSTGLTSSTSQINTLGLAAFQTTGTNSPSGGNRPATPSAWSSMGTTLFFRAAQRIYTSVGEKSAVATTGNSSTWASVIAVFKGAETGSATVSPGTYTAR
ncbi:MAG: hypothetical protein AB7E55_27450, partial [Pigmentiphaga sp.]